MNPERQNDLEAKLTFLLLGELPASEAFELGRAIEHDPELAKIYQRLEKTIDLVKETSSASVPADQPDAPATLRLSDQRREVLLQQFKTVRPKTFAAAPHARSKVRVLQVAAVFATFAIVVSVAVFSLSSRYELSTKLTHNYAAGPAATAANDGPRQTDVLQSGRPVTERLGRELNELARRAPSTTPRTPIVLPAPETTPASAGDGFYKVTAGSSGEPQRRGSLALGSDAAITRKLEWGGALDLPAGIHSDTNAFIGTYAYAVPQTQWGASVAGVTITNYAGGLPAKDADGDAIGKRVDNFGNAFTPSAGIGFQGGTAPAPAPGQPSAQASLTAQAEQSVAQTSSTPLTVLGVVNTLGKERVVLGAKPPGAGQPVAGGGSQGSINLAYSTTPPPSTAQLTEGHSVGSVEVASVDSDTRTLPQVIDPATGLPLPSVAPGAVEEKVRRQEGINNVNRSRLADSIDPATGLPIPMPEVALTPETAGEPHVQAFEIDPSKLSQALDSLPDVSTPVAQPNGVPRVETAGGGGGGGAGGGGAGGVANVTRSNNQIAVQENMRKLLADSGVMLDANKGETAYFNDRTGKLIVSADPEKLKQIDTVTQKLEPNGQAAGELSNLANLRYSPNSIGQLGDVPLLGRLFTNTTTTTASKPPIIAQSAPPPITPSPYAATNATEDAVPPGMTDWRGLNLEQALSVRADLDNKTILRAETLPDIKLNLSTTKPLTKAEAKQAIDTALGMNGIALIPMGSNVVKAVPLDTMGGSPAFHGAAPPNTVVAGNNFWDNEARANGGRTEAEASRQQIVLPPAEQQLTLSDDLLARNDWFAAEKKESGARYDRSTVYRGISQAGTAVAADGIETANGSVQELNRSKSQDEFKSNLALNFSTTPAQAQRTPETSREARQNEEPGNVYSQNIVGYANVSIKDGKSLYANPFTNRAGSEKQVAAAVPTQIAQQEREVERLRKDLKVPDSLAYADGPSMLLTAEAARKLDAQRVELEAALAREKTVLTNLSGLPKRDLEQRIRAGENSLEALTRELETAKSNDISSASNMRPYFEAKNKLEELKRFNQALNAKVASETIESALPKSTMVMLMDPASPEHATSSLWDKLQGKYETKARIKIETDRTDIPGVADYSAYDPHFIQIESETIQSDAVLGRAVTNLNLNREWARKGKDASLSKDEAVKKLRKMLDVKPAKGTSFVDIGVKADKPEESAKLANAVAEAYQDYRKEEARELSRRGIVALNESIQDQDKRIANQQAVVDKLRENLKVPASVARPDLPALITQNAPAATPVPQKDPDLAPRKPSTNAPVHQAEIATSENAFSTFSLNVSDVSFKLAAASLEKGVLPEPASVRSEEFINAFDYRDPEPAAGVPVGFAWDRAQYPFAQNRDVLRFSIKTAAQGRQAGSPLNLVLLLDNSGSMERADRVHIIHESLRVLAAQLQAQDKLSVVLFSRTARLLVDGVSGTNAMKVAEEVSGLTPEGGTNLEEAMNLAYQTAARHYLANGINRVVLLTDGAANLGDVEPESLKQKVEANRKQGIALDCFGIGWEGYNDDLLEVLSRNGDGRYGFINSPEEAATEFAGQLAGALNVAASDVKVQVEFNPARVKAWRQIGYAKHQLTKEQFRDNTVDAAEIAAAESGNAVYVIEVNPNGDGPLGTVRVRFNVPGTSDYREHEWAVPYTGNAVALEQSSPAMRLAATASAFSEWLAANPYAGEINLDRLLGYLSGVTETYGADARPRKLEWMLRQTKSLAGK